MIQLVHGNEWVHRAKCPHCGCTGPMASSVVAAKMLALLCGWDGKKGICQQCRNVFEGQTIKAKQKKEK